MVVDFLSFSLIKELKYYHLTSNKPQMSELSFLIENQNSVIVDESYL